MLKDQNQSVLQTAQKSNPNPPSQVKGHARTNNHQKVKKRKQTEVPTC